MTLFTTRPIDFHPTPQGLIHLNQLPKLKRLKIQGFGEANFELSR